MASFVQIKNDVLALLIDTPAAVQSLTGSFVNRAIRRMQRKHDFKVMEADASFTTVTLTRNLGARPSDWIKSRGRPYFIEEMGTTRPMSATSYRIEALRAYGDNTDFDYGEPRLLFENETSGQFEVFPYPDGLSDYSDGEYRITVPYWKMLPDLVADGDTNWFTSNAEDYITYRATAYGFYANEDEPRGDLWFRKADEELLDILRLDKKRRWADTQTLVPHYGAMPPHTQE